MTACWEQPSFLWKGKVLFSLAIRIRDLEFFDNLQYLYTNPVWGQANKAAECTSYSIRMSSR